MIVTSAERLADFRKRGWWGDLTVDDLLQRNRTAVPDRTALVDPMNRAALDGVEPRRLTWAEVGHEVDRVAAALLGQGLKKGDVLSYQLPNVVDTVILALACSRIGLIISPVPTMYREHEFSWVQQKVKPRAIVTVRELAGFNHAAMMSQLAVGHDTKVLVLGDAEGDQVDFRAAIAAADPELAEAAATADPAKPEEVFTIFWTSGTESRPKGVPRDHNLWIVNAKMVTEAAEISEGEVLLNPFPLVNIGSFGLVMPWLWQKGTLVLHHPFDLGVYLKQIEQEKVNYTIAAPAILNAILKTPAMVENIDLSSLRAIGSGSAPLAPWMIEGWAQKWGIEVCNIFGSNEGASLFSGPMHVPDHTERARYFPRMGAEGIEWSGETASMIKTRLVDPATEEIITEPGVPGELRFWGAATFEGYFDAPELTANAFDAEGYYRTGDLFEIAGEGHLSRYYRFVGRCKDIIVRGGVNISPAELDDLLSGHPALKEAAVCGIPDDVLGEKVCAAIVPAGEEVPDVASLAEWLKGQGLATFKLPQAVVQVEALPRNSMNKVVRTELREHVLGLLKA